jgi:hypothetical protein
VVVTLQGLGRGKFLFHGRHFKLDVKPWTSIYTGHGNAFLSLLEGAPGPLGPARPAPPPAKPRPPGSTLGPALAAGAFVPIPGRGQ